MKTLKKLLLLASTALAAAAFAAPGLAQADELTEFWNPVEPGTQVNFHSTNFTAVYKEVGTLKCELVTLEAEVLENGPELIELEVHGSKYQYCNVPVVGKQAGTFIRLTNGAITMPDYAYDFTVCSQKGTLGGTYALETGSFAISGVLSGCYLGNANVTADFWMQDAENGAPIEVN